MFCRTKSDFYSKNSQLKVVDANRFCIPLYAWHRYIATQLDLIKRIAVFFTEYVWKRLQAY